MSSTEIEPVQASAADRPPGLRALARHPAHWVSLCLGVGLSPWAPGTVATLWAWMAFTALDPWLTDAQWAGLLVAGLVVGAWACTRTAQRLSSIDPGSVVWDEVIAFWAVLWLLMPASLAEQALAFAVFRLFDAAKPGPVGWADRLFAAQPGETIGWRHGVGILFDDLVAALCTLVVMALWRLVSA